MVLVAGIAALLSIGLSAMIAVWRYRVMRPENIPGVRTGLLSWTGLHGREQLLFLIQRLMIWLCGLVWVLGVILVLSWILAT